MSQADQSLVAVRDGHRFDEAALARWLAAHVPGFETKPSIRQFQGGQSNPTFLLESGGRRAVLRKKPPGVLLPSAHQIEREYKILSALRGTGVPIPQALALCEDASIIGTSFYVMDFIDGDTHDFPDMPGATVSQRRDAYADMIATMARLHAVDWEANGLSLSRPENFLARQIERWGKQYRAAALDVPDPAMAWLESWLVERKPADSPATIVHGDFRIGNLLFARGEGKVLALLDWELTTLGDPLSDLGYLCLPYRLPPREHGVRGMKGLDFVALGIPTEEELLAGYCARAGRAAITDWSFYLVFALFRLASISQGIYARALAGNASSAGALVFGAESRELAKTAKALAGD